MCWTSRHVSSGFASRASAMMAAAMGAEAEVPVCLAVHIPLIIKLSIFSGHSLPAHVFLYMIKNSTILPQKS